MILLYSQTGAALVTAPLTPSTALASVILSCRLQSGDGPSDNYMRSENLNSTDSGNVVNGINTTFSVKNFPVVTGKFMSIIADNRSVPVSSIVTAEPIGQFTLQVPPTTSLYASYYYMLFDDTTWTEFINSSLELLNIAPTDMAANDILNVPSGLLAVAKMYASYFFCMRIAKQTGLWYNQRLQERVDDRDSISKKWQNLADAQMKTAIAARDSYYSGAGTDRGPAMSIVQHQPRNWTPYR